MFLALLLDTLVRDGALTLIDADGTTHRLGPVTRAASLVVRLGKRPLHRELAGSLCAYLRTAYVDGALTVERGTIFDLLELYERSIARSEGARALVELLLPARSDERFLEVFPYDEIFESSLDSTCALFGDPSMTLAEAYEQKNRHLAAKLLLRPGQTVLDIGSAWGALAMHLAEVHGVEVTGIAASHEQAAAATEKAVEARLADRVAFRVGDVPDGTARYDRIVSTPSLEDLMRPQRFTGFGRLFDVLAEDGVAVVQCVARASGAGRVPSPSQLLARAERAGLQVIDVEVLRYHAAETLRCWRERLAACSEMLTCSYGGRALRTWEFDLGRAEAAFRHGGLVVAELQLAKRLDAVPLTRDYLQERWAWTRRSSGTPMPPPKVTPARL
jgi:cyclopropane-fatty-acyl-phospholipid synthase